MLEVLEVILEYIQFFYLYLLALLLILSCTRCLLYFLSSFIPISMLFKLFQSYKDLSTGSYIRVYLAKSGCYIRGFRKLYWSRRKLY